MLEIVPAQNEVFARWMAQKHSLRLDIDPARLNHLAGTEYDRETFELRPPKLGVVDEKTYTLACWMRHEIQNNELGFRENLDSLATIFALHLLRNHSSLKDRPSQVFDGGLQGGTWCRINSFIQEHLSEPLPLERLASIASLSPSHFTRAFRHTVGQSPHQYVISPAFHMRAI